MRHDGEELILEPVRFLRRRPRGLLALEQVIACVFEVRHLGQRHGQPLLLASEGPLGFPSLGQCGDGRLVHAVDFLRVTLLIVQSPGEELVGAVGEIDRRDEDDRFPEFAALDDRCGDGSGRARDHEAGAAPEKLSPPRFQTRGFRG